MPAAIIGRKLGMTRLFDEVGRNVPVTVISVGPCRVSQVKTTETDGYDAVQLAFEDAKVGRATMPLIGHDAKAGLVPQRIHSEVRLTSDEVAQYELGQTVTVEQFEGKIFVDVTGTSKGRGFSGGMRRWNFKGLSASHGTERKHRSPGSIGGRASNLGTGKIKKGGHMAGQYGNERTTIRSLEVVQIDKDQNLILVKGPVPGPNQGIVYVRESVRLSKAKGKRAAKAS